MHPSDEIRSTLALRQAALVGALVSQRAPPPGFDSVRIRVAAVSLIRKRAGSIARLWPELVDSRGQSFQADLDDFARSTAAPESGDRSPMGTRFPGGLLRRPAP